MAPRPPGGHSIARASRPRRHSSAAPNCCGWSRQAARPQRPVSAMKASAFCLPIHVPIDSQLVKGIGVVVALHGAAECLATTPRLTIKTMALSAQREGACGSSSGSGVL